MIALWPWLLAAALAHPAPYGYQIHHRQTQLRVLWDGKSLQVTDRHVRFQIPAGLCGDPELRDFFALEAHVWKNRPSPTPDPIKIVRGNETFEASGRSQLGLHLLGLTSRLRVLKATTLARCREMKNRK